MRKQNERKNLYCLENGMTEKQNNLASLEKGAMNPFRRMRATFSYGDSSAMRNKRNQFLFVLNLYNCARKLLYSRSPTGPSPSEQG